MARSGMSSVAVAERGQVDPDHVEAVEQVGAEPALLDLLLQDLVAGRDDPDVDLDRLRPADALELARSGARASSLAWRRGRDVAGLVEQQRAAVGQLEPADLAPLGARECALLVPEQLALQQRVVEHRAVRAPRTGPSRRVSAACTARATSSLPVPVSPWISTVEPIGPTCSIRSKTLRIFGLRETIVWK